jgi:hypothetical protein
MPRTENSIEMNLQDLGNGPQLEGGGHDSAVESAMTEGLTPFSSTDDHDVHMQVQPSPTHPDHRKDIPVDATSKSHQLSDTHQSFSLSSSFSDSSTFVELATSWVSRATDKRLSLGTMHATGSGLDVGYTSNSMSHAIAPLCSSQAPLHASKVPMPQSKTLPQIEPGSIERQAESTDSELAGM